LQCLKNGIEVAGEFGGRNDFEHDAIVDPHFIRVKRHLWRYSLIAITMLAACQQAPTPAIKHSVTPSPSGSPLAACPSTPAPSGPHLVVRNLPAPDDLALGLDARLYFSDITGGRICALNPAGSGESIGGGMSVQGVRCVDA